MTTAQVCKSLCISLKEYKMNEKDLEKEFKEGIYKARPLLKAIKLKCLDCCGGV